MATAIDRRQVEQWLAEGLSLRQIAQRLGLPTTTFWRHWQRLQHEASPPVETQEPTPAHPGTPPADHAQPTRVHRHDASGPPEPTPVHQRGTPPESTPAHPPSRPPEYTPVHRCSLSSCACCRCCPPSKPWWRGSMSASGC